MVAKSQVLTRGDFPELGDDAVNGANGKKAEIIIEPGKNMTLDEVEEQYIRRVIKDNNHRTKGELCDILGISRPTFERKLEKYGITIEKD